MFFLVFGIDKDVIKIGHNEFSKERLEDFVHKSHEYTRAIGEPKKGITSLLKRPPYVLRVIFIRLPLSFGFGDSHSSNQLWRRLKIHKAHQACRRV